MARKPASKPKTKAMARSGPKLAEPPIALPKAASSNIIYKLQRVWMAISPKGVVTYTGMSKPKLIAALRLSEAADVKALKKNGWRVGYVNVLEDQFNAG